MGIWGRYLTHAVDFDEQEMGIHEFPFGCRKDCSSFSGLDEDTCKIQASIMVIPVQQPASMLSLCLLYFLSIFHGLICFFVSACWDCIPQDNSSTNPCLRIRWMMSVTSFWCFWYPLIFTPPSAHRQEPSPLAHFLSTINLPSHFPFLALLSHF